MSGEEWFTAEEIANLQGWGVPHVRNLALRHQWRRLGTRPQRYNLSDVIATTGDLPSRVK